mgnify:CR=1 FL=1
MANRAFLAFSLAFSLGSAGLLVPKPSEAQCAS